MEEFINLSLLKYCLPTCCTLKQYHEHSNFPRHLLFSNFFQGKVVNLLCLLRMGLSKKLKCLKHNNEPETAAALSFEINISLADGVSIIISKVQQQLTLD